MVSKISLLQNNLHIKHDNFSGLSGRKIASTSSGVKSLLLSLPCTEEKRDEWELVYQMDQRNG